MVSIRDNLARVMERIERAALKAGRQPEEVRLVAVSKTVDPARIREAVEAGASLLGENYIQEAQQKIEALGRSAAWHFIGHLQSNKAKVAVRLFDRIHSLDSLSLAVELDRRAAAEGRVMPVLIEVNLAGETTKFGTGEEKALELARQAADLKHLSLDGLMTMPPFSEAPELSRPYFVRLRDLREKMAREGIPLRELSMGMSNDFEVAVEEGATFVRVGSAIFGPRA
jgi:pyridoxal phosphate enzyme (YggS family)